MSKDPLKRLNTLIHGAKGAPRFRELGEMADELADEIERLRSRVAELEGCEESPTVEERRLARMRVHNLTVSRNRIRRDLRVSDARVAELEAALIERPVPCRTLGFKLLAIVEIESDGEGRWEERDGTPFSTGMAFGWMLHPSTASGRAFHGQPDQSREVES